MGQTDQEPSESIKAALRRAAERHRAGDLSAADVIERAQHPYTRALLNTTPRIEQQLDVLPAIPGRVPAPDERGTGCPFHPRCDLACDVCRSERPELIAITPGHVAACHEIVRA